jgi:putative phosphotransacetylase
LETNRHRSSPIPPNDQLIEIIVEEVQKTLQLAKKTRVVTTTYPRIPLGVSNRHIHLTQNTFAQLFGVETAFESDRPLYQPNEFASKHVLTIIGSKMRSIANVRILGPLRNYDQVELTLTDSRYLGIDAPVQNSGNLKGAAPLTLVGPVGSVYIKECALVASRHIHMTNGHAQIFGVKSGDICRVKIGGVKSTIFENVLVRINDDWKLQIHLDTDDANAAYVRTDIDVEFIGKM